MFCQPALLVLCCSETGFLMWSVSTKHQDREFFMYLTVHLLPVCQGTPFAHECVSFILDAPGYTRTRGVQGLAVGGKLDWVRKVYVIHTRPLLSQSSLHPGLPAQHTEKSAPQGVTQSNRATMCVKARPSAKETKQELEYSWPSVHLLAWRLHLGMEKARFQDTIVCRSHF